MISNKDANRIIQLVKREVVPAIGCTEPAAVSLCVAKATELLETTPEKITLLLSGNIIKNAMGVGIPGTGMIGLPIAVALGALIGKSQYGLEVLRDVNAQAVENGKNYIASKEIKIMHCQDAPSNLHIDVTVENGDKKARAIISREHTNFIFLQQNDKILFEEITDSRLTNDTATEEDIKLTLQMVHEFATTAPLEDISFILESRTLNKKAAELALSGEYGHSLGTTMRDAGKDLFGDTPLEHMISYTSAACDARMGGAPIAVMSNSGSGNQGITATMPVVSYAEDIKATDEQLTRALMLSHLTSIYIKQSLGRLSALCGCVVASTGASSGLVYLMGGGYPQMCAAVKNMVANITGMLCDGAKPSCAMKISSGVSTAMLSAMLAMNGKCVTSAEGIVAEDVDQTILNLTSIGREAMTVTDQHVLHIMCNK